MATRGGIIYRLLRAMRSQEFAVGISFLEVLAQQAIQPRRPPRVMLWVPANLVQLAQRAQSSDFHRVFLLRVMRAFVSHSAPGDEGSPSRVTQNHVNVLIRNLGLLSDSGHLRVIEETDARLEEALEQAFPRSLFAIELSAEQNFVARYVGAVLRWSKKTGKGILEGGERVINHIGSTIASLRIPERTKAFFEEKERLATELLGEFGISKTTKKIIAITTSTAGVFLAPTVPIAAAIGLTGLLISYTDP